MELENFYPIIRIVHIYSMRTALILLIVAEGLLLWAANTPSAPRLFQWSLRLDRVSLFLRITGILAGIVTAIVGGWNLLAPWLLLAYGLMILHNVFIKIFIVPWQQQLQAQIAGPTNADVIAFQQALIKRDATVKRWIALLIFLSIFPVMLLKPSF
jgi:hypothetical protein